MLWSKPQATVREQVGLTQLATLEWDPYTRPSEPILFPKLRIHFADFPYLHYSVDQRLLTLETCCGHEYGRAARLTCPRRGFHGPPRALRAPPLLTATLFGPASPFSGRPDSRAHRTLQRDDGSPRCSRQRSPFSRRRRGAPRALGRRRGGPFSAARFRANLSWIPFRR